MPVVHCSILLMLVMTVVSWTACGDSAPSNPNLVPGMQPGAAGQGSAGQASAGSGAAGQVTAGAAACMRPVGCDDISTAVFSGKACCTPVTPCGYELMELDAETEMLFPQARETIERITEGDPNHRCAPESWFFGERPSLYSHRYEPDDDSPDILVSEECPSYSVLPHILPGCCLPDNTCGLSTSESYPTFETFDPSGLPFTKPECVSAEELNRQFSQSTVLYPFARTKTSGTCDYAALAAMFPPSS
jgi:hypothetical protein